MTSVQSNSLRISELGLACCAVEANATALVKDSLQFLTESELAKIEKHILVVAGTVTHALKATIQASYNELSEPRVVVAFGACAISGGPYWDSYSVLPGASEVIPVDIFVPGCPPAPEDLAKALRQAIAKLPK